MVLIQADEQFKTIDRVIPVRHWNGHSLDPLSGGTKPGTERRPVHGSMMLDMVHQMRDGRRIEECGQPHQRDSENRGVHNVAGHRIRSNPRDEGNLLCSERGRLHGDPEHSPRESYTPHPPAAQRTASSATSTTIRPGYSVQSR